MLVRYDLLYGIDLGKVGVEVEVGISEYEIMAAVGYT